MLPKSGLSDPSSVSDWEIADVLKSLWQQYMRVVDLTITLCTGTLLVFANIAFSERVLLRLQRAPLGVRSAGFGALLCLAGGAISAVVWRMLSLAWMEIECIGSREVAIKYLKGIGVLDTKVYAFAKGPTIAKRYAWRASQYMTGAFILAGWVLLAIALIGISQVRLP